MISNKEIDNLFMELGYIKKTLSDNSFCYMKGDMYCKFEYVSNLHAYVLSSAENYKEANHNLFEDDELYSDLLDEKKILDKVKSDLKIYFEEQLWILYRMTKEKYYINLMM